jgi:hypothetical protein
MLIGVEKILFGPVISSIYSTSKRQIPITSLRHQWYINQHDDKTWTTSIIASEPSDHNIVKWGTEGRGG